MFVFVWFEEYVCTNVYKRMDVYAWMCVNVCMNWCVCTWLNKCVIYVYDLMNVCALRVVFINVCVGFYKSMCMNVYVYKWLYESMYDVWL